MNDELRAVLSEVLGITPENVTEHTSTQTEPKWDSLRHMNLIFALEDCYGVRFSDEEIPSLTSVSAVEAALVSRGKHSSASGEA